MVRIKLKDSIVFNQDGEQLDLEKIIGLRVNCFMCTNLLKEKGAILLSPPTKEYSDNVDKIEKFHLCKKCYNILLNFSMGKINQVEVPPKLDMIYLAIMNNKTTHARNLINKLKEMLLKGEPVKIDQGN